MPRLLCISLNFFGSRHTSRQLPIPTLLGRHERTTDACSHQYESPHPTLADPSQEASILCSSGATSRTSATTGAHGRTRGYNPLHGALRCSLVPCRGQPLSLQHHTYRGCSGPIPPTVNQPTVRTAAHVYGHQLLRPLPHAARSPLHPTRRLHHIPFYTTETCVLHSGVRHHHEQA